MCAQKELFDPLAEFPPFPPEYQGSGVLLPVTALPSHYGLGDMGPGAFAWIDRLQEAGQSWWQALPLGPTGYRSSPYQSCSSFAANGLLVSPDLLVADGLLSRGACEVPAFSSDSVDYGGVIELKTRLLVQAWTNFCSGTRQDLVAEHEQSCRDEARWLDDYALYRALKQEDNAAPDWEWPEDLIRRTFPALSQGRDEIATPSL